MVHYWEIGIRMNTINNSRVYMRFVSNSSINLALSKYVAEAIQVLKAAKYDLIVLETSELDNRIPKLWIILMFRYM